MPLAGGADEVLYQSPPSAALAVDAAYAYLLPVGGAPPLLLRRPLDGGSVEVLTDTCPPAEIALDDVAVYWTETCSPGAEGRLMRLAK